MVDFFATIILDSPKVSQHELELCSSCQDVDMLWWVILLNRSSLKTYLWTGSRKKNARLKKLYFGSTPPVTAVNEAL